jgi:hypothetical protein
MGKTSQRPNRELQKQKKGKKEDLPPEWAGRSRDEDVEKLGECPGTFRWGPEKTFQKLPAPRKLDRTAAELGKGWGGYLMERGGEALISVAQSDGSMIDGLSFSVTLLMAARKFFPQRRSHMEERQKRTVVVMGAAARAEQRVALDTNYFDELGQEWENDDISVWFVGPEISLGYAARKRSDLPSNLSFHFHRGTVQSLFREDLKCALPSSVDLFVGFNAGFGSFVESKQGNLLLDWLDDLYFLAESGATLVFTCANDYGDV